MLRQEHLKAILLILVLGVITYFNAFANRFVWDDRALIIGNELIRDWKHIPQIFTAELYRTSAPGSFYRPIQTLSYLFDYSIWQLNPYGYHFTNLLIHIVNGILVYFIILLSLRYTNKQYPIALFTALLFIVHPVHVQAVTYISGRADLLACLFLLIAFILFINGKTFLSRIVSSLSFIFALLSKEVALIFPVVLLAWINFQRKRDSGKAVEPGLKPASVAPFFAIAFIYVVLRMTVLRFSDKILPQDLSLNFGTRLLTSFKTLTYYIRLLLSPFGLHAEYMVEPVRSFFTIDFLMSLAGIVVITILLVWAYRTDRILFFWGIFFLITLFPVMNVIPINAQMSEHFLYVPSIGFFMVFTGMIYSISRLKRFHSYQWLPAVILTLIIFCCVVITIDRNADWRDEITLFQKTTESSPGSYRAHFNLGVAYYNAGLYNEAIIEFRNALELNPESIDARQNIEKAQKKFEEISRGGTVK